MKAINTKRAQYMYKMFQTNRLDMNIGETIRVMFKSEPSFSEKLTCHTCKSTSSYSCPILSLNDVLFSNDFANLETAILANLPTESKCKGCKKDIQCKREYGQHIFVDVSEC